MAKVQDFLATEGCDWRFIPHMDLTSEDYGKQQ
jgi:hypothetical protein